MVHCFFLLWILANILSLVHEMYTISITKMFPQVLSKPSSVNGMIFSPRLHQRHGPASSIYQGSLWVADFIPGLKWTESCSAEVMVNHFYIYLCPSVLLGTTVCSQLSWFNLFSKTTQSRTYWTLKLHGSSRWSPKYSSSPMNGLFSIHRDRLDQNSSD